MTTSPVQIPQPDVDKALPIPPALFTPGQMGAAAFFGSLAAAGWLARRNLRELGKPARGNAVLAFAAVGTIVLMVLAIVLPDGVPAAVFTVPQVVAALSFAKSEFGVALPNSTRPSNWRVAGVAAVTLVIFIALMVLVSVGLEATGLVSLAGDDVPPVTP